MLHIYNTLTHQKEPFKPLKENQISMYVCGITVYDFCHLGHARCFVAFDAIVKFLRATGWQVKYVRNITDIDDKIIHRAQENDESIQSLTQRFTEAMHEDEQALHVALPDQEPKATDYMPQIIEMCQTLEKRGLAYVGKSGDLFFSVEHFPEYGKLSRKDLDKMQSGVRIELNDAKQNPLDFVLWKKSKEGEPSWDSPWGEGRPGWHIECSAMSTDCLGHHFDIHGGGHDLIFPHHENEIAQSVGAHNHEFVNTWMHVGFVQVNKEKMSKSLNNFFTIREILKKHSGEVVRYFLLASHYRSPLNYSEDLLDNAKSALTTLYTALRHVEIPKLTVEDIQAHPSYLEFVEVMNDDFNTPMAMSVFFELARQINTQRQQNMPYEQEAFVLKYCANVLGLLEQDPEVFFQGESVTIDVQALIHQRNQARADKDWAKADEIRDALLSEGITLEDTAEGTLWRKT